MPGLMSPRPLFASLLVTTLCGVLASCSNDPNAGALKLSDSLTVDTAALTVDDGAIRVLLDDNMHMSVSSLHDEGEVRISPASPAHYVRLTDGAVIDSFAVESVSQSDITDAHGNGVSYTITGQGEANLSLSLNLRHYDDFPGMVIMRANYENQGEAPLSIANWVGSSVSISGEDGASDFWSFQGSSHIDRRDWVQPLTNGYVERNFMGMNASDYGGGTPVIDVWTPAGGIAVGHVENVPKLVSLPISVSGATANLSVEYEALEELAPGASVSTFDTFVSVHEGDYYASLKAYSQVMARRGLVQPDFPDTAYEAIWCAWGYERGFNVEQVLATLPKAKELGLEWAVLDDGWQTAEGDWYLNLEKFPRGDADMIAFVDEIKGAGLQAKLWIAPLAVDPGTDLLHEHSDMLLLGKWGEVQDVTWWNSFTLCPAYGPTVEHSKELVRTIMGKWGYAGLKIDGQHLNSVAPCYNPAHNHDSPQDSVEGVQDYWKAIYETAMEINPEAVVEICPCGTSYAFHNTPYMNQTVASDPLTSWQIRHKGKTLKALTGDSAPYYADHVELSDDAGDFATAIGIGAVVGTKFTYPTDPHPQNGFILTPEKEEKWAKWISLYNEKMLPKGIYRGELYDIGFDAPETHAIEKDDSMYFAFYSDEAEAWSGSVELRGLAEGQYQLTNYFTGEAMGQASASENELSINFTDYLLIEASRINE